MTILELERDTYHLSEELPDKLVSTAHFIGGITCTDCGNKIKEHMRTSDNGVTCDTSAEIIQHYSAIEIQIEKIVGALIRSFA